MPARKIDVAAKRLVGLLQSSTFHGSVAQAQVARHVIWIERNRLAVPRQPFRDIVGHGAGREIARGLGLLLLCDASGFFPILIDVTPNSLGDAGIALPGFLDRALKRRIAAQATQRLQELIDLRRRQRRRSVAEGCFDLLDSCRAENVGREYECSDACEKDQPADQKDRQTQSDRDNSVRSLPRQWGQIERL